MRGLLLSLGAHEGSTLVLSPAAPRDGVAVVQLALERAVPRVEGTAAEYAELLEAAKPTLPVPFRDDGPPLGLEFDPIPPPPKKRKKNNHPAA